MYIPNGEDENFKDFMYDIIGKDLKSQTMPRLEQRVERIPILRDYVEDFKNLMTNYPKVQYRFFEEPNNDKYIFMEYLEEYYEHEEAKKTDFEKLRNQIYELRDKIYNETGINILYNDEVKATTVYDIDFSLFPNAIKYRKHIAYLICDKKTYRVVNNIITDVMGKDPQKRMIDVQNQDFSIDGLCCFKIEDEILEYQYERYCYKNKICESGIEKYIWGKVCECQYKIEPRDEIILSHLCYHKSDPL